ncbi:uncharacterized protein G2W53_026610 [Senna tora]|uniref:Uncharacterized protein n=1 Tax=Senna tora TaxID=362788 RepID=A0A834THR6_9FABA|nr:uncharacterized protein G2W53_026610 [Senna tora]
MAWIIATCVLNPNFVYPEHEELKQRSTRERVKEI